MDITRQAVVNLFTDVHVMFGLAYKKYEYKINSSFEFVQFSNVMLEMIADLDRLLASNDNFLLSKWINGARSLVENAPKRVQDSMHAIKLRCGVTTKTLKTMLVSSGLV